MIPKHKTDKIYWLVKIAGKTRDVLGFMREKRGSGFLIVGGPTGSHHSGHMDDWKEEIARLLKKGYLPDNVAKKEKLIPWSWKKPELSKTDHELIRLFHKAQGVVKENLI